MPDLENIRIAQNMREMRKCTKESKNGTWLLRLFCQASKTSKDNAFRSWSERNCFRDLLIRTMGKDVRILLCLFLCLSRFGRSGAEKNLLHKRNLTCHVETYFGRNLTPKQSRDLIF